MAQVSNLFLIDLHQTYSILVMILCLIFFILLIYKWIFNLIIIVESLMPQGNTFTHWLWAWSCDLFWPMGQKKFNPIRIFNQSTCTLYFFSCSSAFAMRIF